MEWFELKEYIGQHVLITHKKTGIAYVAKLIKADPLCFETEYGNDNETQVSFITHWDITPLLLSKKEIEDIIKKLEL